MRFHTNFRRVIDSGDSRDDFADDVAPAFSSVPEPPASDKDNVLNVKVGGVGNTVHRVAVGYRFDDGAAGAGADLTAALWCYDHLSEQWYKASTGTLKDGEVTYFKVPCLADPPQTTANMGRPGNGGQYMLVVADPLTGDGTYHFVMGADTAQF